MTVGSRQYLIMLLSMALPLIASGLIACTPPVPEPVSPIASFEIDQYTGKAPFNVICNNKSLFADEYQWDFGDGTSTTNSTSNVTTTHEYTKVGSYTITLTATKVGTPVQSDTFSSTVDVQAGNLELITIASQFEVQAGMTRQLQVNATDQYGNLIDQFEVSWSIVGEEVGSIDQEGVFTAGSQIGRFVDLIEVQVKQAEIVRSANVSSVINPGPLAQIAIAPETIDLGMGMQQRFVAVGADKYGNRISGLDFIWSAEGTTGTINRSGLFTAGMSPKTDNDAVNVETTHDDITKSATASVSVKPDRIAFLSDRAQGQPSFDFADQADIYVMNVDGSDQERLTTGGVLPNPVMFSPDGRRIGYSVLDSLRIINYDGSWEIPITVDHLATTPAWSPRGDRIVFSSLELSSEGFSAHIYIMDVDGGNIVQITDESGFLITNRSNLNLFPA